LGSHLQIHASRNAAILFWAVILRLLAS